MSTPQKITIVHVIFSLTYGGAENQVIQLLNGLSKQHLKKILVTFQHVDSSFSRELDPEIMSFNMNLRRWGQIRCIFKLYRLFRRFNTDVVHAHLFHTSLYTAIAARLAGVPVVLTTEHGEFLWKKAIHHTIEKLVISPLVDMRVAVSKDIQNIRIKSRDVPKHKIKVIPNCVKVPKKPEKYKARKRLRIGTVGRLVPAKDYRTLIMAFNTLIKDRMNCDLIFVGDGPEQSELKSMVQDLGISEYVTFLGFQAEINSLLSEFDIFILSSIREGIPVSMLEAMAMRVPVVVTNVGGIPEVIENSVDGILVESQNPEMIANALRKLGNDSSLRRKMGEAGYKKVKSLFSREAICRQYEQLYFDLLRHSRK